MTVTMVQPDANNRDLLRGAQFSDAYSVMTDDTTLDARSAAQKMFATSPRWVKSLMKMRDAIVAPFGLKTEKIANRATDRVGIFPVISETPARIVAGVDDRHLDFRVVVEISDPGPRRRVTATTIVLTHNWLGRVYLATIMPFHRLVVRALLRQVAR